MATIVQLSEQRRKRRPADEIPAGGARILLFLGVRYERHDEALSLEAPSRPARGGAGRKARKRA